MVFFFEDKKTIEDRCDVVPGDLGRTHTYQPKSSPLLARENAPQIFSHDFSDALYDMIQEASRYISSFRFDFTLLSDLQDVLPDAVLNGVLRGNEGDLTKKVRTTMKFGALGFVVYVRDEGNGFDYRTRVGDHRLGGRNYQNKGLGFARFEYSPLFVAYHGCGNELSIATPPVSVV